jgi:hypothetical protein
VVVTRFFFGGSASGCSLLGGDDWAISFSCNLYSHSSRDARRFHRAEAHYYRYWRWHYFYATVAPGPAFTTVALERLLGAIMRMFLIINIAYIAIS